MAMKRQKEKRQEWIKNGHGEYEEIPGTNCIKIRLPGKSILGDYFQENRTSRRPFLLLRINFPGRPIFIQLPPVLLSTETTHAIVQGICTDSGAVDERCFDAAVAQILKSLEAEYFRDFLRSECYAKYQGRLFFE